ncbi:MAG: TFIIB-type zinc ribbon-containing protein [Clostridia bacterium]|nr:TFIIB-type zinc ribbon-containing protein [Clostridia bacterium]
MAVLTYKCPACGSALNYEPQSGKFACAHCESLFDEAQLIREEEAEQVGGAVVYSCPNCGGEVVTDETTAASFCYYCHSPVVLKGRVSGDWKPDGVLPFTVTREKAQEAFLKWAGKKRFTPAGFSAKKYIDKVTGVYYPYWVTRVEFEALFEGKGSNASVVTTADRIITTTKHYRVMRKARMAFQNLVRPALNKQDRLLADGVQPYRLDDVRPFTEYYLSGFQAERRDVEAQGISQGLQDEAEGYARNLIRPKAAYQTLAGDTSISDVAMEHRYILLPAWVVTYKAPGGKIDYYIVNGQTEKTCGVLPVSKQKLWGFGAAICAAVTLLGCIGGYVLW